jgi:hypothetical protein
MTGTERAQVQEQALALVAAAWGVHERHQRGPAGERDLRAERLRGLAAVLVVEGHELRMHSGRDRDQTYKRAHVASIRRKGKREK